MKGIKKVSSLVVAAAMLSASLFSAHAAEVTTRIEGDWRVRPTGWNIWGSDGAVINDQEYVGITENGHEGNGFVFNNVENKGYIAMMSTLNEAMVEGEEYTLSYWYKGTGGTFDITLNQGWDPRYTTAEEERDGEWHFVETKITATAAQANDYFLIICEWAQNCVIDDLSLKNVNGDELIKNGDFEETVYLEMNTNGEYYTSNSWRFLMSNNEMIKHQHYARPTKRYARSGEYGMHFKYTEPCIANHFYRLINNQNSTFENGKEYCIELWVKGNMETPGCIRIGTIWGGEWMDSVDYNLSNVMIAGEVDKDGWQRYYQTFTAESDRSGSVQFLIEATNDFVADDVKIYKTSDESKANIVNDGSFEDVSEDEPMKLNNYKETAWTIHYRGIDESYADKYYYIEPSDKVVHSGNYSMHLVFPESMAANKYVQLYKNLDSVCEAGEYTLTFYTKGNLWDNILGVGWGDGIYSTEDNMLKEEQPDGWVKYTRDITVDGVDDNFFNIVLQQNSDFYLDDISFVKKGTEENLLSDGGFEQVVIMDNTKVSNLMSTAVNDGNAVRISWTNPDNNYIDDIKLYVGGVLDRHVFSLQKNAFSECTVTNLESYVKYPVELVMTIKGKEYRYTTDAVADGHDLGYRIGNWYVERHDWRNTSFNIDRNEYIEGAASMRIDSNVESWIDRYYPHVGQTVTLNSAKTYKLSFMAKAENIGNFKLINSNPWTEEMFIQDYGTVGSSTHDWQEYTAVIKPKETNPASPDYNQEYNTDLKFCVETGKGSLWIDDIKLYECMPNGNVLPVSTNLIKNGGFEYNDYTVSEPSFKNVSDIDAAFDIKNLESGLIEVKVKIKNYTMGDGFKPALIVALYDGKQLVSMSYIEQKVIENIADEIPSDELAITIEVPELAEGTDYSLKVMCWDGIGAMKALDTADILIPAE